MIPATLTHNLVKQTKVQMCTANKANGSLMEQKHGILSLAPYFVPRRLSSDLISFVNSLEHYQQSMSPPTRQSKVIVTQLTTCTQYLFYTARLLRKSRKNVNCLCKEKTNIETLPQMKVSNCIITQLCVSLVYLPFKINLIFKDTI